MADFIDEMMGFDPTNLTAFQEPKSNHGDVLVYKTNPKDSKAEDGVYRSVVRLLVDPSNPKDSIVHSASYYLQSMDGNRLLKSPIGDGDRSDPIFCAWKRLWFSGDDSKKEFSKAIYNKNEANWCLVQILEDENKPEDVGHFMVMKLPKDIFVKLSAKMNPSAGSKNQPYPVMDPIIGLMLNLEVQPGPDDPKAPERKNREIKYSLSDFGDYAPIIQVDGKPLFNDDELGLIDTYVQAINDMQNGRTQKKKDEGKATLEKVKPQIRPLYKKALDYMKTQLATADDGKNLSVREHCGYKEWDDATKAFVEHFTQMTDAGVDPKTMTYQQFQTVQAAKVAAVAPQAPAQPNEPVPDPAADKKEEEDKDLPF